MAAAQGKPCFPPLQKYASNSSTATAHARTQGCPHKLCMSLPPAHQRARRAAAQPRQQDSHSAATDACADVWLCRSQHAQAEQQHSLSAPALGSPRWPRRSRPAGTPAPSAAGPPAPWGARQGGRPRGWPCRLASSCGCACVRVRECVCVRVHVRVCVCVCVCVLCACVCVCENKRV